MSSILLPVLFYYFLFFIHSRFCTEIVHCTVCQTKEYILIFFLDFFDNLVAKS